MLKWERSRLAVLPLSNATRNTDDEPRSAFASRSAAPSSCCSCRPCPWFCLLATRSAEKRGQRPTTVTVCHLFASEGEGVHVASSGGGSGRWCRASSPGMSNTSKRQPMASGPTLPRVSSSGGRGGPGGGGGRETQCKSQRVQQHPLPCYVTSSNNAVIITGVHHSIATVVIAAVVVVRASEGRAARCNVRYAVQPDQRSGR